MAYSVSKLRDLPHFRLSADELANWLDTEGSASWWSVDGDPLLTGRLSFPCPSSDLSEELRRIKKDLLLFDWREPALAGGETIGADKLDEVAYLDRSGRAFRLCWESDPDYEWLLLEDLQSASFAKSDDGVP